MVPAPDYGQYQIIAVIGVENLIIVNTPDATLVVNKDRAEEVSKIMEKLKNDDIQSYIYN